MVRKKRFHTIFLSFIFTMIIPLHLRADFEAVINIANKFNTGDLCECPGCADLVWASSYDIYLSGKLNTWGYDRVTRAYKAAVKFSNWADSTRTPIGNDNAAPFGVDSADVGYINTHGNVNSAGTVATILMGYGEQQCNLTYGVNADGNNVRWGNGDLNYLFIDACNSLNRFLFLHGAFTSSTIRSSPMVMMLGYHGHSYDGEYYYNMFKGYVDGVRNDGLGDDWVDEMSKTSGSYRQCATALVWASNASEASNVYLYAGFMDLKAYGTGYMSFTYIAGCSPSSGAPDLPN